MDKADVSPSNFRFIKNLNEKQIANAHIRLEAIRRQELRIYNAKKAQE